MKDQVDWVKEMATSLYQPKSVDLAGDQNAKFRAILAKIQCCSDAEKESLYEATRKVFPAAQKSIFVIRVATPPHSSALAAFINNACGGSADRFVTAVQAELDPKHPFKTLDLRFSKLRPSEQRALQCALQGLRGQEVAAKLNLSSQTTPSIYKNVSKSLGLNSQKEILQAAICGGMLAQPTEEQIKVIANEYKLLTPQPRRIFDIYGSGLNAKQTGKLVGISEGTVREHIQNIYDQMHISNSLELTIRWTWLKLAAAKQFVTRTTADPYTPTRHGGADVTQEETVPCLEPMAMGATTSLTPAHSAMLPQPDCFVASLTQQRSQQTRHWNR